jgi:hypothetical protein
MKSDKDFCHAAIHYDESLVDRLINDSEGVLHEEFKQFINGEEKMKIEANKGHTVYHVIVENKLLDLNEIKKQFEDAINSDKDAVVVTPEGVFVQMMPVL